MAMCIRSMCQYVFSVHKCYNVEESPLEGKSCGLLRSPGEWDNLAPFPGWLISIDGELKSVKRVGGY